MTKHTAEPWEFIELDDDYLGVGAIIAKNQPLNPKTPITDISCVFARGSRKKGIANANRIVSCVNACAGMDDPQTVINRLRGAVIDAACKYQEIEQQRDELILECDTHARAADDFADQIDELMKQRDELLAIANRLAEWCEKYPSSRIYNESYIRKIAAEIDAIGADAREAIAKAGEA